jgi:hypothetical protein
LSSRAWSATPRSRANGGIFFQPDKVQCEPIDVTPAASSEIFSGVDYRTISLAMSRVRFSVPVARLANFHGEPAVQVNLSQIPGGGPFGTVAMCQDGAFGATVSFMNLFVEQFRDVQALAAGGKKKKWVNVVQPELPLDHIWETDI